MKITPFALLFALPAFCQASAPETPRALEQAMNSARRILVMAGDEALRGQLYNLSTQTAILEPDVSRMITGIANAAGSIEHLSDGNLEQVRNLLAYLQDQAANVLYALRTLNQSAWAVASRVTPASGASLPAQGFKNDAVRLRSLSQTLQEHAAVLANDAEAAREKLGPDTAESARKLYDQTQELTRLAEALAQTSEVIVQKSR